MRLIDVDLYCATICKCNMRACDRAKCPIHNAPTAYSVDKVVEELEEEAERWEDSGKEYKDKCEIAVGRGLRIAIEIVKQGGIGKVVE